MAKHSTLGISFYLWLSFFYNISMAYKTTLAITFGTICVQHLLLKQRWCVHLLYKIINNIITISYFNIYLRTWAKQLLKFEIRFLLEWVSLRMCFHQTFILYVHAYKTEQGLSRQINNKDKMYAVHNNNNNT